MTGLGENGCFGLGSKVRARAPPSQPLAAMLPEVAREVCGNPFPREFTLMEGRALSLPIRLTGGIPEFRMFGYGEKHSMCPGNL